MSQTHKPLSEDEEQTVREDIPYWIVATQTKTDRKLHISNGGGELLCKHDFAKLVMEGEA